LPFFSFLSLLRQRKKQRKATFVESLRATKEAKRWVRTALVPCMALVFHLSVVLYGFCDRSGFFASIELIKRVTA
jgi:hypothetical protein